MRELNDILETEVEVKTDRKFNTKAFCIVFMWGWVLVSFVGTIIFAFYELPIRTIALFSNLLNTFQVLFLLISLLITYKIITSSETEVSRFLKKMRDVYLKLTEKTPNLNVRDEIKKESKIDDVEAAGYLVGEMTAVVIHKLQRQKKEQKKEQQVLEDLPQITV